MIKFIAILVFVLCLKFVFGQTSMLSINGYVEDVQTGERLIAASVYQTENQRGVTTNNYGFFSIAIPKGTDKLSASYLGYHTRSIQIDARNDTNIVFQLVRSDQEIEEVVVNAQKDIRQRMKANQLQMATDKIAKIPVILGETDIMKAYQLMPGVQGGLEATAGMVVRGSDPGQNLILLDGVPVYNVNHLFGLFSVFNTDAIKSSTLLKGNFPARYGGRAASVLDIRMKEGNNKSLSGSASVGLISSKLLLEGPLVKNKTSFLFTVRRTYIDLFAYPYFKWILHDAGMWTYNFHDLNFKLNHIINDRNRIYLSYYNGRDKYGYKWEENTVNPTTNDETNYQENNGFNWGNNTGTMRWNHQFGNKLFGNTTLIYTRYRFETRRRSEELVVGDNPSHNIFENGFYSGITDYGANIDLDYRPGNNHQVRFGALITQHQFKPGVSVVDFTDLEGLFNVDSVDNGQLLKNLEFAAYLEDEFTVADFMEFQLGLRYSMFMTDKMNYSFIEPRSSIRFMPIKGQVLSMAYSRTTQPIHLLTNSSVGFPTDQWVPVTDKVKPIMADQYNLSWQFNIGEQLSTTISSFYKTMENVLEYKENADKKLNWQEIVEQGKGTAQGIELLIEKKIGKTTGWLAYTLSKSDRTFVNINEGRTFPYKYDRRHDFKIVLMHQFNKNVELSANWIFNTGYAVTLPLEIYVADYSVDYFNAYQYSSEVLNYEKKNDFRMPNYHRLDIAVNLHKQKKRFSRTWTFGLYNVYMRRNALYYDFYQGKLRSHSVIPIMPSINYSIHF